MAEAFNSILGAIGKFSPVIQAATAIPQAISTFQEQGNIKKMQDRQIYYATHPEAYASLIKSFQQPLQAGLVQGVGNQVQGQAEERGLAYAPGIYQQVLAQALAPYQQNEQQMAMEAASRALGLPFNYTGLPQGPQFGPGGLASILAGLQPAQPANTDPWGFKTPPFNPEWSQMPAAPDISIVGQSPAPDWSSILGGNG